MLNRRAGWTRYWSGGRGADRERSTQGVDRSDLHRAACRHRSKGTWLAGAALALLLLAGQRASASGAGTYTLIDLGPGLGAWVNGLGDLYAGRIHLSINASGQVAGWVGTGNGNSHAALNDITGTHDLGTLGDPQHQSIATGINAPGQIVGGVVPPNGGLHAFLYENGLMRDLETDPGAISRAHAINSAGQVVGMRVFGDHLHAFMYDGAGFHDLGTLGGRDSGAYGINDAGHVVGWSVTQNGGLHAFLYDSAGMHDLGTLGGDSGWASAVNASGQVVGWSRQSREQGGLIRPFLYDSTGMHDLGSLGGNDSLAFGINASGQVVGTSSLVPGASTTHAFLYSGGVLRDLNSLLPPGTNRTLTEAHAINDQGEIVGLDSDGHAFLLTPVSDPRAVPPQSPTGLSAIVPSANEVDLAWTDQSTNEQGFVIERKTGDGDWTKIAAPPSNSTRYQDTAVDAYTRYTYRVRAVNGAGSSDWSNEVIGDTSVGPRPVLSGSGGEFGEKLLGTGSVVRTISLTNTGGGTLAIRGIRLIGANVPDFTITGDSGKGKLAPGAVQRIDVSFQPTAVGDRSAWLQVTDNATDSPQLVPLTGKGTVPRASVDPARLSFGDQLVGTTSSEQVVTVTNPAVVPLTIQGVSLDGDQPGDFVLAAVSGLALAPGQSGAIHIRFRPTATGSRSAVLTISDGSGLHLVALAGNGIAPGLTFGVARLRTPARIDFGKLPAGTSATQSLTLTNSGTAPLTINSMSLSGSNASDFKLDAGNGPITLAPRASRTLTLRFTPSAPRPCTASLTIQDNAPGSPHVVALRGTGTLPPPKAPGGLSAKVVSGTQIQLTWTSNSPDATAFAIWRKAGSGSFQRYSGVGANVTRFVDRQLQPNTAYTYEVRANGPGGVSGWSDPATGTTPPTPPAAPTGLTVDRRSPTELELIWTDNSSNETAFAIWRKAGTGAFQRYSGVPAGVTHFTDRHLEPGVTYTYRVRANGAGGVSGWSNEASEGLPPGPPVAIGGDP